MKKLSRLLFASLLLSLVAVSPVKAEEQVSDPWESMNRGIFWFNEQFDRFLLKPIAEAYDWIMPDEGQKIISNFFHNLAYPRYLVNHLLQGKWQAASQDTARFMLNTTMGAGGFFDVAERVGVKRNEEDMGLTLAHWGAGPGPYLVIPILGPSNVRDAFGRLIDAGLDPFNVLALTDVRAGVVDPIVISARGADAVNTRSGLLEPLDSARESSIDFYLFMQGAYYQHRWGEYWDGNPPDGEEDDTNVFAR